VFGQPEVGDELGDVLAVELDALGEVDGHELLVDVAAGLTLGQLEFAAGEVLGLCWLLLAVDGQLLLVDALVEGQVLSVDAVEADALGAG
jgi:hypothetical protein